MKKYIFIILISFFPLTSFASIAIDASNTDEINPNTTLSIAHTTTGDNLVMFVGVHNQGGNLVTGVTYNSVDLTEITRSSGSGSNYHSLWYLLAPDTGLHNVVITMSGSSYIGAGVVTYTGVDLTQDFTNFDVSRVTATSATVSLTTTEDNSMLFGYGDVVSGTLSGSGDTDIVEAVGTGGFTSLLANTTTGAVGTYDFTIAGTSSVLTTALAVEVIEAITESEPEVGTAITTFHTYKGIQIQSINPFYLILFFVIFSAIWIYTGKIIIWLYHILTRF